MTLSLSIYYFLQKKNVKAHESLQKANDSNTLRNIASYITDEMFNVEIVVSDFYNNSNISEFIFVETASGSFDIYLESNGFFTKNGDEVNNINDELKGKKVHYILITPKKLDSKNFLSALLKMTPKVNILLLPIVVFAAVIPLYSNLFNSRLMHNESFFSVLYITSLFVIILVLEFLIRQFIHYQSSKKNEINLSKVTLFLNNFFITTSCRNISIKMKNIESAASSIWDNYPMALYDITVSFFLFVLMFILLKSYAIAYAAYYVVVVLCFVALRFITYKKTIASLEDAAERTPYFLSFEAKKDEIIFSSFRTIFNMMNLKKQREELNKKIIKDDNQTWSEALKLNTFISMVVIYSLSFFAIKNNDAESSILIALILINSRISGSISSFINRIFMVKVQTHHMIESMDSLLEGDDHFRLSKHGGIHKIESLKVSNLNSDILGKNSINDLSFSLEKGKRLFISGESGSGKTTVINHILGINESYSGQIYINDTLSKDLSIEYFEKELAYMPANVGFISGSLMENFHFYGIFSIKDITHILNSSKIDIEINHENLEVKDISELKVSTGEKQKLLLFMIIHKKPSLLVMDEPTSSLSSYDSLNIFNEIIKRLPESIIIISSHNLKLSSNCDEIINLNKKSNKKRIYVENKQ